MGFNTDGWKSARATARIHWICSKVDASKVIDIGCCKGVASILLARQGFDVVGVDFDAERIEYANADREKESPETQERLRFVCGDVYDVALPEHTFHTAIMGEFLEHQARPDKAIKRAYDLLVDNGRLVITVPFGLHIHPDHKQTFYVASLYRLIYPCFGISELQIIGRYLCLVCKRREAVLKEEVSTVDLAFVERAEQEFQRKEVALAAREGYVREKAGDEKHKAERDRLKSQLKAVRNTFSYRLGNMLVQAVASPGRNTILLPYRLIRLLVAGFRTLRIMAAKGSAQPNTPTATPSPRKGNLCPEANTASTVKQDMPARAGPEYETRTTRDELTEVSLTDVPLTPSICMVMKHYVNRLGVAQEEGRSVIRFGGHPLDDWRRVDFLGTLLPQGRNLLDVGCGGGRFLNLVASLDRFHNVVGVDIRRNKQFFTVSEVCPVDFVYASADSLPFSDGLFDVVTCLEVLEHLDRDVFIRALSEIRRVTNRMLIVTVPYNEPEPIYRGHKLRFTDSDLLAYFPHGEFIVLKKSTGRAWVAIVERFGVDVADGGV